MNRELWDSFLSQIDAQVEGDFLSLAAQYESVTGHPFKVKSHTGNNLLFSMLKQALMTQDKALLIVTMDFIGQLSSDLQKEFQLFTQKHIMSRHSLASEASVSHELKDKPMTSKILDLLHLKRTA